MKSELDIIKDEIKEIKKIVGDIKKMITKPKYTGEVKYGNQYHMTKNSKLVSFNLSSDDE